MKDGVEQKLLAILHENSIYWVETVTEPVGKASIQ